VTIRKHPPFFASIARPEAGGKAAAEISLEKEENTLGKQQKIGYDKKKEKSTGP
jgi:hypothetical protein